MFWNRKKLKSKSYKCSVCGLIHDMLPAITFDSPSSYSDLTDDEKMNISEIDSDFCVINYDDQIDRFIRVVLFQKIINSNQYLEYGLWVSLSEESFVDYSANFDNVNHENQYFGWLNNWVPGYENTMNIPTTVFTKKGNERPEIVLNDEYDHQFVKDYNLGISKITAEKRVHEMMKNVG